MTGNNHPPISTIINNKIMLETLVYLTRFVNPLSVSSSGRNVISQLTLNHSSPHNQIVSSIISHNLTKAASNKVMEGPKKKDSKWSILYKIVLPTVALVGLTALGYKLYKQIQSTREFLEGLDESEEELTQVQKPPVKKIVWTPKSVNSEIISSLDRQKKVINILVLYGTEFGFSKQVGMKICEEIVEKLNNKDDFVFVPRLLELKHFNVIDWNQETCIISVCSTYGEGVPPNAAQSFFQNMEEKQEKSMTTSSNIYYSVLALGDKSYTHFCRSGKTLDSLFETKFSQSERIHDRFDIDRDDWRSINKWLNGVIQQISERRANFTLNSSYLDYLQSDSNNLSTTIQFDRTNPYFANVSENRRICIDESNSNDIRECIHFAFDLLNDKSLNYECGDALGVLPENDCQVVDTLFKYLCDFFTSEHGSTSSPLVNTPSNYFSPGENSPFKNADSGMPEFITLKEAITRFYDLKQVSASLLQLLHDKQDFAGLDHVKTRLDHILEDENAFTSYIQDRWVEDILEEFLVPLIHKSNTNNSLTKSKITIQNIIDQLKVLVPRYYSISSSALETRNEKASITVSIVTYNTLNKKRKGVATNFLKDQSIVPIFISKNRDFKLPSDTNTPIIMIGPGTGIAPFMGFIQERLTLNAKGKNILFFGCRDRNKDFLYRNELENWSNNNFLELHTAFSREDPKKKVYVQDLILQNSEILYNLIIKENAHIYICGDGSSMCPAVIETFKNIFKKQEGISNEQASHKIEQLEHEKRLCRDVW